MGWDPAEKHLQVEQRSLEDTNPKGRRKKGLEPKATSRKGTDPALESKPLSGIGGSHLGPHSEAEKGLPHVGPLTILLGKQHTTAWKQLRGK